MKRKPPVLDKPYPRNRPVREEEIELWNKVVEGREVTAKALPPQTKIHHKTASIPIQKKKLLPRNPEIQRLDATDLTKIRRGVAVIDATLDLHGHTQASAYDTLIRFILRARENGFRTILVITGKGRSNVGKTLREQLPRWLAESPLRDHIIAYDNAGVQHGGSGAWYIRIRKL